MKWQEVIERLEAMLGDEGLAPGDVTALKLALEAVQLRARRPANSGKPWSVEDEARIAAGHAAGQTPAELAAVVGRSKASVTARLVRLGLLDASAAAALRYPV
mgnify:CR=1 FL=1